VQPESPAPKKEHYSVLNATTMKTKNENLIQLKKLSKLKHPGSNPDTCQKSAIGKKMLYKSQDFFEFIYKLCQKYQ